MRWGLERTIAVGFGVALVILIIVDLVSYWSLAQFAAATESRALSFQVIRELEATLSLLKDAEAGQRGFLITNETHYLVPYQTAIDQVDSRLQTLRRITSNEPIQQERLDQLADLVARKLAELKQTIDVRRAAGFEAAQQIVMADVGQTLMNDIRALAAQIAADEQMRLEQRDVTARVAGRVAIGVIVAGSSLAFMFVALAGGLISRGLAERRRTQAALTESERRLQDILDNASTVVYVKDLDGRYLFINRQFATRFHVTADQVIGQTDQDVWPQELANSFRTNDRKALEQATLLRVEEIAAHDDGPHTYLSIKFPLRDTSGSIYAVCSLSTDITDRKRMEDELRGSRIELEHRVAERTAELGLSNARLQATNRALRILSECNQILVRAADEDALLQRICQAIVEFGGYATAQVALTEPDSAQIARLVASANHVRSSAAGLLAEASRPGTLNPPRLDPRSDLGPMGAALQTGQTIIVQSLSADRAMADWRAQALDHGAQSAVALPLWAGEQVVGTLGIYAAEPGAFAHPEEVKLLTELAGDLSFGLGVLRTRKAHRQAEDQVRLHAARAEILSELSRRLAEISLDYQAVLDAVARRIVELIGDICVVHILSADERWLNPAAVHHRDPDALAFLRGLLASAPQRADEGWSGRVFQGGQALRIPVVSPEQVRALTKPDDWPWLERYGVHSLLGVPLRAQNRILGLLMMVRTVPGLPYTIEDQALVQDLADRAALVITNARLFESLQRMNVDLEERVAGRTLELQAANRALQQAKQDAEQANHAKSEFLSRMSHELRTPLNAILGFAQVLDLDELDPRQRRGVKHILTGGRHLLDLINEVLDITRIETGRMSISPEAVQVDELMTEVLELVRPLAFQRRVTLEPPDILGQYVHADRQRLKQVLLNLLSNAVKYNYEQGRVVAAAEVRPNKQLRLTISDTGPGIPADKLERVFIPFDRLGAEHSQVEGTGLGLALSQRLIEAMGGHIGVESMVGQGSRFWVELDLAEEPMEKLKRTGPLTLEPASTADQARTVLYVEDNLSNLQLVEQILALRPAIRLLTAMQGGLALDLAYEYRPDVILLDLHLPDMSGSQVLDRLRANPQIGGIPVVIISADATTRQFERLQAAGARDYLTKPLDVKHFLKVLDDILYDR